MSDVYTITPGGLPALVNVAHTDQVQQNPKITPLADGSWITSWSDTVIVHDMVRNTDVPVGYTRAQHFDQTGQPVGATVTLTAHGQGAGGDDTRSVESAIRPDGTLVTSWTSTHYNQNTPSPTAMGVAGWTNVSGTPNEIAGPVEAAATLEPSYSLTGSQIVGLVGGEMVFVTESTKAPPTISGGPDVIDRQVVAYTFTDGQTAPISRTVVSSTADQRYFQTYAGGSYHAAASSDDIGYSGHKLAATLGDGNILVAWERRDSDSAYDGHPLFSILSPIGSIVKAQAEIDDGSGRVAIAIGLPGGSLEQVMATRDGGFTVFYDAQVGSGGYTERYARHFDGGGNPAGPSVDLGSLRATQLVTLGTGYLLVENRDYAPAPGYAQFYGTQLDASFHATGPAVALSTAVNRAGSYEVAITNRNTLIIDVSQSGLPGDTSYQGIGQIVAQLTAPPSPIVITSQTLAGDTGASATDLVTTNGSVTLHGTADLADVVTVFDNGQFVGVGALDGTGGWSFTKTFLEGKHVLHAEESDSSGGNRVVTADQAAVTVDNTAPGIAITSSGGPTNRATQTIAGSTDAGASIAILEGSTVLGTATAGSSGTFSVGVSLMSAGQHSLTAQAVDTAGNVGTSAVVTLTLQDSSANRPAFGTTTTDAHSPSGEVYALYDGLLGRAPDALGLEYWADQFSQGVLPSVLAEGFLASPEGQARSGSPDNGRFVDQLYDATLHRGPDQAGHDYWTGQLNSGVQTRADVGVGFSFSAEHITNIQGALDVGLFGPDKAASDVARIYYAVLDRAPDAAGLQFWTTNIKSGIPLGVITDSFLSAPEVQAKTGSMSTAQYVDLVYENALGRHAEASGLAFWLDAIDHKGAGRVSVTTTIGESQEAQVHHLADIEAGWHLA